MTPAQPFDITAFTGRGLAVEVHNNGHHITLRAPDVALDCFIRSSGEITWMAFGKSFQASAESVLRALDRGRFAMPPENKESVLQIL